MKRQALRNALEILQGLSCTHLRMRECHPGCGHWSCPECGLYWDDGCEPFFWYAPSPRVQEQLERAVKEKFMEQRRAA